MTEFPLSHMPRHTVAHAKNSKEMPRIPNVFFVGGETFFLPFFETTRNAVFAVHLASQVIENGFIVHGGAIEQKVLRRPDLGVQKTNVTGFMRN